MPNKKSLKDDQEESDSLIIEISETTLGKKKIRKTKDLEEDTPKKRGRKPNKEKTSDPVILKKVKKQKESYGLVSSNQKETSVRDLDNPILFLDLKPLDIEEVERSFFEYIVSDYKPEINDPSPFDPNNENYHPLKGHPKTMIQNQELEFSPSLETINLKEDTFKINKIKEEIPDFLNQNQNQDQDAMVKKEVSSSLLRYQKYTPMMKLYLETNNHNQWPAKSEYNCLWEFHPFEGTPWGIPYKFENGKFYARPNFCSPGCAAGYIFQHFDDDEVWEKYSLLNMLFQYVVNDPLKNVIPAPSPECLKINGGFLDIEEFRNIAWQGNREFLLQMPPMIAITATAKLQDGNGSYQDNMEPIYKKRLTDACDELRYKRNKPLTERTHSLHHYFDSIKAGRV